MGPTIIRVIRPWDISRYNALWRKRIHRPHRSCEFKADKRIECAIYGAADLVIVHRLPRGFCTFIYGRVIQKWLTRFSKIVDYLVGFLEIRTEMFIYSSYGVVHTHPCTSWLINMLCICTDAHRKRLNSHPALKHS